MQPSATIETRVQALLDDHHLDDDESPDSRTDLIEDIINREGWQPVHDYLISVLKNGSAPYRDWQAAAEVFWGAALDKRQIDADIVIALLYRRLAPDKDSSENNLVWSIVCKLKGVKYLSDYDPMADPKVIAARNLLKL